MFLILTLLWFLFLWFVVTAARRAQQSSIQRGIDLRSSKHRQPRRGWCRNQKRRSYDGHQHKDTGLAQCSKEHHPNEHKPWSQDKVAMLIWRILNITRTRWFITGIISIILFYLRSPTSRWITMFHATTVAMS